MGPRGGDPRVSVEPTNAEAIINIHRLMPLKKKTAPFDFEIHAEYYNANGTGMPYLERHLDLFERG